MTETNEDKLKAYVQYVQGICQGKPDKDFMKRLEMLVGCFPDNIIPIEWYNFIAAASNENFIQLGEQGYEPTVNSPHYAETIRAFEKMKHAREHLLNTMFARYGLLKSI